ncbi:cytochrome b/b6 domain-containing protein [Glaciecola siphonariae]|uniref:Cytochrome b/b6 domain-containing protein n=1 Tax=Glaciecola siphonariae TaxID=521012 RepID=A0ABV9LUU2_9ALTE
MTKVKVWDVPTRVFHWGLVAVFVFQFVTGDILDDAMQLHFYGGYVALGLILFRIIWGFVGSYHARFSSFIYSPRTAFNYMKGTSSTQTYLGHNPLGGYSVLAILAVMLTQAVSGLFMTDEIFMEGPYYSALGTQVDDIMNYLHHNAISLMWALISLHLGAIAYYSIKKKQALIPAMFHGNKPSNDTQKRRISTPWLAFIISMVVAAAIVYLVVNVFAPEPEMGLYDY